MTFSRIFLPNVRVLLVDDSPALAEALAMLLGQHQRIEVVGLAQDGLQALEKVELLRPDVVVTDLEMPIMDGVDFVHRQMARSPIPIIVFSSVEASSPLASAAISSGARALVRKPGQHGDLIRQLESLQEAILQAHPVADSPAA